jgi:hypothetical protein
MKISLKWPVMAANENVKAGVKYRRKPEEIRKLAGIAETEMTSLRLMQQYRIESLPKKKRKICEEITNGTII